MESCLYRECSKGLNKLPWTPVLMIIVEDLVPILTDCSLQVWKSKGVPSPKSQSLEMSLFKIMVLMVETRSIHSLHGCPCYLDVPWMNVEPGRWHLPRSGFSSR